jgi:hypothetical protein
MNGKRILAFALGSAVSLSLAAPARAGEIHNRKERQQQRIAQGIGSGQLTARETARLETREANLNREIGAMRSFNGGTLTSSERALVNHQQNQLSRSIYRQKHDAQTR